MCGQIATLCTSCGFSNESDEQFCGGCGRPLTTVHQTPPIGSISPASYIPPFLSEKILPTRATLEGERKRVTVLFCDVVNSTALTEPLGPDALAGFLDQFFKVALGAIHKYEGLVIHFLGDGFMALFGAPLAHEDHARRAVQAALVLRQRFETGGVAPGLPQGDTLSVRMGLNTGLVVVGRVSDSLGMEYTAVGDTTNIAARLQEVADPGAVLLGESTYLLVKDYFHCQALGARKVKGITIPVMAYRALRARPLREPSQKSTLHEVSSPLVGRAQHLVSFHGLVENLLRGQGALLTVLGEAGVGKSRLVAEVRTASMNQDLLWLEGRADSFSQGISYWPFTEMMKVYTGIREEDDERTSWAKLERKVQALFPGQRTEILPYLATLLAIEVKEEFQQSVKYLDGEAKKHQIFRSCRLFFERLAQAHKLVLVFEDWHWADESSMALLEHLLPLIDATPLLVCCVSRLERESPLTRFRDLAAREYAPRYTEMTLPLLSERESTQLFQNLLEIEKLPLRIRNSIFEKTEGNPFFLEEVVRTLIHTKAVVRNSASGPWQVTAEIERVSIPDTIQAIIMSRVDRLGEEMKQLLKIAAVIGRGFFYRVLKAITKSGQELDAGLHLLQDVELIREKRRFPELEYIFKHALAQEAIYESILLSQRKNLHRQVGECMESLFANRLEEFYGLLAHHFVRAEEWNKAQEYLFKAGDQAGSIAADAEALKHYEEALSAYARVFGDRWDPLTHATQERKIGEVFYRRGELHRARECLERALGYLGRAVPTTRFGVRWAIGTQLLEQLAHRLLPSWFVCRHTQEMDPVAVECSHIYEGMGWIDYFMDTERFVLDSLNELNLSERKGIWPGVVQGAFSVGLILDAVPIFRLAEHYHRQSVALAEQIEHPRAMGHAYLGRGAHEHHKGEWDLALDYYQRATDAFRQAGDLRGMGASLSLSSRLHELHGEFTKAWEMAEHVARIGQVGADDQSMAWSLTPQGRILDKRGESEKAIMSMKRCMELCTAIPDYHTLAMAGASLGKCYLWQERLSEALLELERSHQLILEKRLVGFQCTHTLIHLTEAYLALAEQTVDGERKEALRKAQHACRLVLKQSKVDKEGFISASRWRGSIEWMKGNQIVAQKWWERSVRTAEQLKAPYELALTHLEMGRMTGDLTLVEGAASTFAQLGAAYDLHRAEGLLATFTSKAQGQR